MRATKLGATLRFAVGVAAVASAFTSPLRGSDWPRVRGPTGAGVSTDRGLPGTLDPEKIALWSVGMPRGNSSPVVVGGRVFLTAHEGEERLTLCLDAATGEEIWRRAITRVRGETFHRLNGFS